MLCYSCLSYSLLVGLQCVCAGAVAGMTVMGVQLFCFEGQLIWSRQMLWAGAEPELWAQLDASWLPAGQTSPQSQAYWEVQHRDTHLSKLSQAPTWSINWSSGLALVNLPTEHSVVTYLKLKEGQEQSFLEGKKMIISFWTLCFF